MAAIAWLPAVSPSLVCSKTGNEHDIDQFVVAAEAGGQPLDRQLQHGESVTWDGQTFRCPDCGELYRSGTFAII